MLRAYVRGYNSGEINPTPNMRTVRETLATANIDSDRGLGIIVVPKAMEIAIEKAKNTGVGMVTISNGRHLGMASYHAMMALKHDMIGICMTGCPPPRSCLPSVPSLGWERTLSLWLPLLEKNIPLCLTQPQCNRRQQAWIGQPSGHRPWSRMGRRR